jgi:regulator of replication initiation timing
MANQIVNWKKHAEELAKENEMLELEVIRYKNFWGESLKDGKEYKEVARNLLKTVQMLRNENAVLHRRCDDFSNDLANGSSDEAEREDDAENFDFDEPDAPSAQEQYVHMNYTGCI